MKEKIKNITFGDYAKFIGYCTILYCTIDTVCMTAKGVSKLVKKIKRNKENKSK